MSGAIGAGLALLAAVWFAVAVLFAAGWRELAGESKLLFVASLALMALTSLGLLVSSLHVIGLHKLGAGS